MRTTYWLVVGLTLALAEAEVVPGVRVLQSRPKRQGLPIIFPDSPLFDPSPRFPNNGPGRFAPRPPNPSLPTPPRNAHHIIDHDPDAALELPPDLDLNAMDRDSLSRINSIDNITAFADLFGILLPTPEDEVDFGMASRIPLATPEHESDFLTVSRIATSRGSSEMATMANCKPELRTVELDLPVEANTLFYPTCVRLEQCGGCCYGPLLTCRPTVTKLVKLKVLKTVISLSSSNTGVARSRSDGRRRRRRRRRQTLPSYHEVEAIKHVQCECGCKVQEQDCNPAVHKYVQGECACVCKRRDEKEKCEQQNDTKYWDDDSCACYCRRPVDCGTGEFFSQDSCKCERPAARRGFLVDAREDFIERRRPIETLHRRRSNLIRLRADAPRPSRIPILRQSHHPPRHEPSF